MSENNEMNQVSQVDECSIKDCPCAATTEAKLLSGRTLIICDNHKKRITYLLNCIAADFNELISYGFEFEEIIHDNIEKVENNITKTCADCGAPEDESIRFGGFNRNLCLACRGKEMARIDRYVKLHGDKEDREHFETTMEEWRIREMELEEANRDAAQADMEHDMIKDMILTGELTEKEARNS
ncbi:MAG: hypothetical protein DRP09_10425 [Candidatus Thorarchaeota archaeon]|nr:MAG: hypothetical protein DRP09_10425 [Candidatus Thorarchaeota archaeon]